MRQGPGRCGVCRQAERGLDEVVLEVWDQYIRDDDKAELDAKGGSDKKRRRSSTSKPNDLYGESESTVRSRCNPPTLLKLENSSRLSSFQLAHLVLKLSFQVLAKNFESSTFSPSWPWSCITEKLTSIWSRRDKERKRRARKAGTRVIKAREVVKVEVQTCSVSCWF